MIGETSPRQEGTPLEQAVLDTNMREFRMFAGLHSGPDESWHAFTSLYVVNGHKASTAMGRGCDPVNRAILDKMYATTGADISAAITAETEPREPYKKPEGYYRKTVRIPVRPGLYFLESYATEGERESFFVRLVSEPLPEQTDAPEPTAA